MTTPGTAQEALNSALRTQVAPILREAGYKGSPLTWLATSARGDWAVVNVQRSKFSSARELHCVVNLALAPEPWLSYTADEVGLPLPAAVQEYHGLWRSRLEPSPRRWRGRREWWAVCDEATAASAASDIAAKLTEEGLPRLDALIDRTVLLEEVRHGRLGNLNVGLSPAFLDRALLVLLADEGASDELEQVADRVRAGSDARHAEDDRRTLEWAERRAAARSQERGSEPAIGAP